MEWVYITTKKAEKIEEEEDIKFVKPKVLP